MAAYSGLRSMKDRNTGHLTVALLPSARMLSSTLRVSSVAKPCPR